MKTLATERTSTWSRAPSRLFGLDTEADSADEPSYFISILVKLESPSVQIQPLLHTVYSNMPTEAHDRLTVQLILTSNSVANSHSSDESAYNYVQL